FAPPRGAGSARSDQRAGRSRFLSPRLAPHHRGRRPRDRQLQPHDRRRGRRDHRPVEAQGPNDRIVNPWYYTIYHLTRFIAKVFFRFRVIYPERVIEEGPVILAMNHQSYLD